MDNAALAPVLPRIGSLLRLMASDKDGEVLGAVRALGRTLEARGATFHDLADRIEQTPGSTPKADRSAVPTWETLGRPERLLWLDAALGSGDLNVWEQKFALSLRAQYMFQPSRQISPKQVASTNSIISKIWLSGVRI